MRSRSVFSFVAGLLLMCSMASAQSQNVTIPIANGLSLIGVIDGQVWLVVAPRAGGACQTVPLGAAGTELNWVFGTPERDEIVVITEPFSYCGFDLQPLDASSGPQFLITGGEGDDVLLGGRAASALWGGPGDDAIVSAWSYITFAGGESGNDVLVQLNTHTGGGLMGAEGNDLLCNLSPERTGIIDGGPDFDESCGQTDQLSSIETPSPNDCDHCVDAATVVWLEHSAYWTPQ